MDPNFRDCVEPVNLPISKKLRLDLHLSIFLAVLACLVFDESRVSFIESHWDEDACITIGWLLSKGWKLYGDVFTHHMPLDYIPSWAIARYSAFVLQSFVVS